METELNKYKEETAEITALSEAIGMDPNNINLYVERRASLNFFPLWNIFCLPSYAIPAFVITGV